MNKTKYRIAKIVLTGCFLLFIAFISLEEKVNDVPASQIENFHIDTKNCQMKKGKDRDLLKYYGISADELAGYCLYVPSNMMSVDEALILKAKSKDQIATYKKYADERVAKQKKSFDGYGTNQTGLLKKAIVYTKGNYLFLGISKKNTVWKNKFTKLIER